MSYEKLLKKVGFPRHSNYFEVATATWMQKIIFNMEPEMITDYEMHSTYPAACKVTPKVKPKSASF